VLNVEGDLDSGIGWSFARVRMSCSMKWDGDLVLITEGGNEVSWGRAA
jgi:hypothetical protein